MVANVVLKQTKGHDDGWVAIAVGWGIAVAVPVYAVGWLSGAHINPAVTIGLATIGEFDWVQVPGYIVAQVLGALVGGIVMWLTYLNHWAATDDAQAKLAVFCTSPEILDKPKNFLTEVIGTTVLVFGILGIGASGTSIGENSTVDLQAVYSTGIAPLLVGVLVLGVGLSLGGPTGYAINPARDLGPRIAHAILPVKGKGDSNWSYGWVPVAAPFVGGIIGAVLFTILPLNPAG